MLSPILNGSRSGAPPSGSTLMTSAPRFERSQVDKGAATNLPKSSTRMSFNTSNTVGSCRGDGSAGGRFLQIESGILELVGIDGHPSLDEALREFDVARLVDARGADDLAVGEMKHEKFIRLERAAQHGDRRIGYPRALDLEIVLIRPHVRHLRIGGARAGHVFRDHKRLVL